MSKLIFNVRTTKHNGNTAWTAYVTTNARHMDNPRPFINGTSSRIGKRHRDVVWQDFRAPVDNDTPEAAIGHALAKIGEFITDRVSLPHASEHARTGHEFTVTLDLGEELCDRCGQGIGATRPAVYDDAR